MKICPAIFAAAAGSFCQWAGKTPVKPPQKPSGTSVA
jgi:hypothetical protein